MSAQSTVARERVDYTRINLNILRGRRKHDGEVEEESAGRALSHIADAPVGIENPHGTGLHPSGRRRLPSCRFIYVQECRHLAESVGAPEERMRTIEKTNERERSAA